MSLLGNLLHGAEGAIGGFLTGGPVGAITGAVTGYTTHPATLSAAPSPPTGGFNMPFPVNGPGGIPLPGFNPGNTVAPTNGACPRGYHLNKHALAATKKHGAVPAHSMCVRNRTINPLNHRALTRSLKRLKRAGKLVRKLHVAGGSSRARIGAGGHKPGCGCFRCRKR